MRYLLLLLLFTARVALGSVIDYGPPQDILGHWEFDLYDMTGAQRGTAANPLYFKSYLLGGQTLANSMSVGIATDQFSLLATAALQNSEITQLTAIATNTASALNDTTVTGNITAACTTPASCPAGSTVTVNAQGAYTITVSFMGTWTATVIAEGQLADNSWVQIPFYVYSTTTFPYEPVFQATGDGQAMLIGGGFLNFRLRATSFTSGSVAIGFDASIAQQSTYSAQLGTWQVAPLDGQKATYSAAITNFSVPSSASTDVFTIAGSATKTIRVTRIGISGFQTTSGQRDVALIKRSTANVGGTSTVAPAVPLDSSNAAGTASVLAYSANPTTLGTSVGPVRSAKLFFGAAGADSDNFFWDFGTRPGQAIVLRGTGQVLAVNLNAVSSGGTTISINVEWTEE